MQDNLDKKKFLDGVEKFKKGKFKEAKDNFEKILLKNPENINILENLALTNYYLKNLDDCEIILKKIIKLENNSKKSFGFLLKVLREQDKVVELKNYIDEGLKKKVSERKIFTF